ncbi:MAG: hypothetical protein BWZ05_01147 [Bacteroidetes bacterium ADurb.BinA245]|jgi:hypothetical protein|nr:MAG: hypothetical protein BWZ05_01147 [Bacteroidetes bacterium ADurb.BinA245]HND96244.1 hypothetical protein [Chitinophagaceae bacterium]HNJ56114.1 hypothetical protein [Chitinophagaceae bacterium]HNK62070.1 hypothetical protein [Chitinophagaceae bacterium]HNO00800.1 hypothetical protein [Chitinophagaceae bacterium]
MKHLCLTAFFIYHGLAFGQGGNPVGAFTPPPSGPTFLRDVFRNREVAEKPQGNVEGSIFLEDSWMYGRIKAAGRAQTYDSVKIKLNIKTGAVHFLNENNEDMTTTLNVEAVMIIDETSKYNNTIFLCNLNHIRGFYQILEDAGDLKLVKQLKIFEWYTQPVNAEKTNHIDIEGDPFLLYKDKLLSGTKKCEDLKEAFIDNQQLTQFIKTNNLKCNQQNDLWRIVRFQKNGNKE